MSLVERSVPARRGGRIASTSALFAATWLLWSGHYAPLTIALGGLSCALVLLLAIRAGFFDKDVYALHLGGRLPRFWGWLLLEIVKGNVNVARIVLHRRLPISPTVVTIDASDLPEVVQSTLANAITLTPGTLTVDVDAGIIEVHCLTREAATDLGTGEMLRRTRGLIR